MFKYLLIFLLGLNQSISMTPCETCISLVTMNDILENKFNAPINTTAKIIEYTCKYCPEMNDDICTKVISNLGNIYETCQLNKLTCPNWWCESPYLVTFTKLIGFKNHNIDNDTTDDDTISLNDSTCSDNSSLNNHTCDDNTDDNNNSSLNDNTGNNNNSSLNDNTCDNTTRWYDATRWNKNAKWDDNTNWNDL